MEPDKKMEFEKLHQEFQSKAVNGNITLHYKEGRPLKIDEHRIH